MVVGMTLKFVPVLIDCPTGSYCISQDPLSPTLVMGQSLLNHPYCTEFEHGLAGARVCCTARQ